MATLIQTPAEKVRIKHVLKRPSRILTDSIPGGSICTTIMESGPDNHNGDGLLGPNSILVVYMDPPGYNSWRHTALLKPG